ncbi:glycoside hydrolase family 66 protein [Microbacterium sp. E-13]|uniref:glycoside hydrolase family 66 protein n=1 Tax=Microbacterium sp. E-13 TaxID=3404048 RepID=UPI003CF7E247
MPLTLLPTRASYRSSDSIGVEVRGDLPAADGTVSVWRLGELLHTQPLQPGALQTIPSLPPGGYGIELDGGGWRARTAIEVTDDPRSRLRYGFVASYDPGKDVLAVAELARRLHLNAIQFYDWAFRHADLLGGGEEYVDALGQPITLATVRELTSALRQAGSASYGYAAVYAVGPDEWPSWKQHALLRPSGEPYSLEDFLFILDPAAPAWLNHFTAELAAAVDDLGFDGFHLDQYGYPKHAATPDGNPVDVAASFARLIDEVRRELPDAGLVFNNVNDFPTWDTAHAPQDAVYIEPWEPVLGLEALARVATRARAGGLPVVFAAYQHTYTHASADAADRAAAFTMATLFSHGATQLLTGEHGKVLVDPYYVRNHDPEPTTMEFLTRWYDFAVEHDALLFDTRIVDVTASYVGDYNDELDVAHVGIKATETAVAGAIWRHVTRTPEGIVVHLINLVGQDDTMWDAPRNPPGPTGPGELRFRFIRGRVPRVRVADPDAGPRLVEVPVSLHGDHAVATLPAFDVWQVVHVSL